MDHLLLPNVNGSCLSSGGLWPVDLCLGVQEHVRDGSTSSAGYGQANWEHSTWRRGPEADVAVRFHRYVSRQFGISCSRSLINEYDLGIGLFLLGFAIWIFDNTFCGWLRSVRESILLPWAALLEAHGWWHVFTGLGAYYWLIWRIWLETCLDGREGDFMLNWPSVFTSVPRIIPCPTHIARADSNGYSNGYANGNEHATGLTGSAKKGN